MVAKLSIRRRKIIDVRTESNRNWSAMETLKRLRDRGKTNGLHPSMVPGNLT